MDYVYAWLDSIPYDDFTSTSVDFVVEFIGIGGSWRQLYKYTDNRELLVRSFRRALGTIFVRLAVGMLSTKSTNLTMGSQQSLLFSCH